MGSFGASWWMVGLFSAHFAVFAVVGIRQKSKKYIPALITFALLVVVYGLRGLNVDFRVGSYSGGQLLRGAAFVSAAFSMSYFVYRKFTERRRNS